VAFWEQRFDEARDLRRGNLGFRVQGLGWGQRFDEAGDLRRGNFCAGV
jgi:hypothetical protein